MLFIPELGALRQGKVRDIYEQEERLFLIASDRISVFDRILTEQIPDKGRILTDLSLLWFERTRDLIQNHVISHPDPNVLIVKKCRAIPLEIIVRGYLTGSLWREYAAGSRVKCGHRLIEGLSQNDPLPCPIVTPTTKSEVGHDTDLTPEEIVQQGIVDTALWKQLEQMALRLYARGNEILNKQGLILVDTKYEFGLDASGTLTLIDEIHTPDSSRFWFQRDLEKKEIRFPDKEFARQWARGTGFEGNGPLPVMPTDVQMKIREGYQELYEAFTGRKLSMELPPRERLLSNLKRASLLRGCFALIVLGSEKDLPHTDPMSAVFKEEGIPFRIEVASAHKHTERLLRLLDTFNQSIEPIVCLTIAGRSNALSGMAAAHSKWPVIACPYFKDQQDYAINIHSTLQMPSRVPVLTTLDPANAALAAVRILKAMEGCS